MADKSVAVVYEKHDYGQGYAESKVGLRIANFVAWYAYTDYRPGTDHDFYLTMERELYRIADAASEGGAND